MQTIRQSMIVASLAATLCAPEAAMGENDLGGIETGLMESLGKKVVITDKGAVFFANEFQLFVIAHGGMHGGSVKGLLRVESGLSPVFQILFRGKVSVSPQFSCSILTAARTSIGMQDKATMPADMREKAEYILQAIDENYGEPELYNRCILVDPLKPEENVYGYKILRETGCNSYLDSGRTRYVRVARGRCARDGGNHRQCIDSMGRRVINGHSFCVTYCRIKRCREKVPGTFSLSRL